MRIETNTIKIVLRISSMIESLRDSRRITELFDYRRRCSWYYYWRDDDLNVQVLRKVENKCFCLQSQTVLIALSWERFFVRILLLVLWGALYRALGNRLSQYSRKISIYLRVIDGNYPYSSRILGKLMDSIISSEILQYYFRVFWKWYIDLL